MKSPVLRVTCLFLFVLLAASSLFAQGSAGFGSITGVVQDPTGAVVAGAKVVLDNPSKAIHREMESTSGGVFNFLQLVPADGYTVSVTKNGFNKYEVKSVTVTVGGTVSLNPTLALGSSATTVEVSGAAPLVDTTKTEVSQVVDSRQIQDLPINGRRVDSFVLLTPGVNSDGPFGLISFRGNPGGNTFLTDGNDTTNQFYNENAGRTRTTNIAQDAVQEFQVVSSNFLAEYGRASGGVINTVTRSGSNDWHGTGYWFFRNQSLAATDVTTNGINPKEHRHQTGGSLGGPIKKNKLFFFTNVEMQRRFAPIVSTNNGSNLFDTTGHLKSGLCTASTTFFVTDATGAQVLDPVTNKPIPLAPAAAQCTAAQKYLESRSVTQLLPRTMDTNLAFAKIDYRPNDKHSFSFSGNYLDFRSPNGIQTQLSLTDGSAIGNNADTNVFDRTGRASWTYLINNNMLNELRFGYFKDRQYDPASPSLVPEIGKIALSVASTTNLGYANGYPRLNPSEQRYQIADSFSWTTGKHSMKFGFDWSRVEDYVDRLANQYGTYSYTSFADFALDFSGANPNNYSLCNQNGNTAALQQKVCHWSNFSQLFGNPNAPKKGAVIDVKMKDMTYFAQDQWKVTPKLTITPGVRFEYSFLPTPPMPNAAVPETAKIPTSGLNVAPRLGIAYAISPKATIRAGYGVFHSRYNSSTIQNLFVANGVYQLSYSLNNGTSGSSATQLSAAPVFPYYLAAAPDPTKVTGSSSVFFADPNWRNPYSQQGNLGLEVEVAKNTSLTVSYVWSRGLHLLQTKDANATEPGHTCTGTTAGWTAENCYRFPILQADGVTLDTTQGDKGYYTTPVYSARPNAGGARYELQSNGNSYYNALLVQLNQRYKWMQNSVAYTWGHSIDYNQGGGGNTLFGSAFPTSLMNGDYKAEKGNSSIDQRHRLVINSVFSPKFIKGEGFLAKYLVNGWQLSQVSVIASSQSQIPTLGGVRILQQKQGGAVLLGPVGGALNSGINGLGGSNRVPWMAIDDMKIGNIFKTDARVAKLLPISGERVKMYLMFEAFNVFNTVIPGGTGPRDNRAYNMSLANSGTFNGFYVIKPNTTYGTLRQTQAPPDGTTARRAQVALRLTF